MDFFIELAVRAGKIPWDELELPEGRTRKACQVMFDRVGVCYTLQTWTDDRQEKTKVKNAKAANKGADAADDDPKPAKTAATKASKVSLIACVWL